MWLLPEAIYLPPVTTLTPPNLILLLRSSLRFVKSTSSITSELSSYSVTSSYMPDTFLFLPFLAADRETENSVNRYSMPVTKSRTAFYDINLDQANTTGFLFGDDDNVIEGKLYTQASNEDNFPVLRREPNMVSQDLAFSTPFATSSPAFCLRHLDAGKGCFSYRKVA